MMTRNEILEEIKRIEDSLPKLIDLQAIVNDKMAYISYREPSGIDGLALLKIMDRRLFAHRLNSEKLKQLKKELDILDADS